MLLAATDEPDVLNWVSTLLGRTTERLLHVVDTSTHGWGFRRVGGKGTQDKQSDLAWQNLPRVGLPTFRLVVEIKAPSEEAFLRGDTCLTFSHEQGL